MKVNLLQAFLALSYRNQGFSFVRGSRNMSFVTGEAEAQRSEVTHPSFSN